MSLLPRAALLAAALLACACAGPGGTPGSGGLGSGSASEAGSGDTTTGSSTTAAPVEDDDDPPGESTSGAGSCADDVIDPGEDCDGSELAGATCLSQGFAAGTLLCGADCTFDVALCSTCGDGEVSGLEVCDGTNFSGQTCEGLDLGEGELGCSADCAVVLLDGCSANSCGAPTPPEHEKECPGQCDLCRDDECVKFCAAVDQCDDEDFACPPGWDCRLVCAATLTRAGAAPCCVPLARDARWSAWGSTPARTRR